MCRMPSPLPGPLRGEPDRELLEVTGTWAKGLWKATTSEVSRGTLANTASATASINAAQAPVGRVA
jgi:hypothetical protein